jgi:hypothetical protein
MVRYSVMLKDQATAFYHSGQQAGIHSIWSHEQLDLWYWARPDNPC